MFQTICRHSGLAAHCKFNSVISAGDYFVGAALGLLHKHINKEVIINYGTNK